MVLKILAAVVVIIVALLSYAALKPAAFRVERSLTISAPAATIFPHIENLKKFDEWNPWAKLDSTMKTTYEGDESGAGAKSTWVAEQMGEGSMTIVETIIPKLVRMELDFIKPFPSKNFVDFTLAEENGQTTVAWIMSGEMAFIPRLMSIFMSMDKMMGKEFEKGLQTLKTITESEGAKK